MLKAAVESVLLAALGITGVLEGRALERHFRPKGVYDRVGAGNFLWGLGVALALVAALYLFAELRRHHTAAPAPPESATELSRTRSMSAMVVFTAAYILLIPVLGYLVPTALFLVVNFTVMPVFRSGTLNVILGAILGITLFVLFARTLALPFPAGYWPLDAGLR
jgi:hypothetical protein